ncbi:MAG: glycosyltransferase family 2 protein [bacterium]|jgi:glycosyltransferase involved in cell wall biosynthesis|nr:glycosyltransferase family 2 protein [bacterium]
MVAQISVVVPLFNECESLEQLCTGILQACAPLGLPCEIIAVDDGSTDGSLDVLKRLRSRDPRIRIISFRRNFGKADALDAGFRAARGNIIITMDADLQDDPREIPRFVETLGQGWDLVSGWKRVRRDPWSKTLPSKLFNAVTSRVAGLRLHDFNCGFKGYRREVTEALHVYGELHRFLPAIAHLKGFRVTEMAVEHHARPFGRSKYGARRLVSGLLDLMTVVVTTRYFKKPLHFFGAPGLLFGAAGALINLWLSWQKLFEGRALSNRPLLFLGILLMILGLQLVSLGLVGEMISRGQKEPDYQVRERLG